MPRALFAQLSNNTEAIKCSAKVTPHGIHIPWKTGTSVVQPVNSDMMIYCMSAFHLSLCLEMGMCIPGFALSANAMVTSNPRKVNTTNCRQMIEKDWCIAIDAGGTMTRATLSLAPWVSHGTTTATTLFTAICTLLALPSTSTHTHSRATWGRQSSTMITNFKNGWLMTCHPYCDDFKIYISAPPRLCGKGCVFHGL